MVRCSLCCYILACLFGAATNVVLAAQTALSSESLAWIGERIYQNETSGERDKLTFWSEAEEFPSFGIGHFIWLPQGVDVPFEATFTQMVALISLTEPAPEWVRTDVMPWKSRAEFMQDLHSPRMRALRDWLEQTKLAQAEFIVKRFNARSRKAIALADEMNNARLLELFTGLMQTRYGQFAMIDYVNFKGFGDNPLERYQGQGWGLLQVLEAMPELVENAATPECLVWQFALAGEKTLKERVARAPVERNEGRWMLGWKNRLMRYFQEIPGFDPAKQCGGGG